MDVPNLYINSILLIGKCYYKNDIELRNESFKSCSPNTLRKYVHVFSD